jgi:small subunit ribosomal protein S2
MPKLPSLEELLQKGVHFGHKESKWHPNMESYIYTSRNGIHILDLVQTQSCLNLALDYIKQTTAAGKIVLMVGTKKATKNLIKEMAIKAKAPYVTERWLGGTITNFASIAGLIKKLKSLEDQAKTSDYEKKYNKKERLDFTTEMTRLEKMIGGIRELAKTPDAIFVTDLRAEKTAVREAGKKNIPIIAIVDTNVDPTGIEYPIPANDDSVKSVELIAQLVATAVTEGRKEVKKEEKEVTNQAEKDTDKDDKEKKDF